MNAVIVVMDIDRSAGVSGSRYAMRRLLSRGAEVPALNSISLLKQAEAASFWSAAFWGPIGVIAGTSAPRDDGARPLSTAHA